jgi:hypothetical protein
MSETPTDPLQLILSQLSTLKAGNDALQESLAKQEARHHEELSALRKDFEERLTALAQSVSPPRPDAAEAESNPAPAATPASGNGSMPVIQTPPTTQMQSDKNSRSERLPDPPAYGGKKKDLPLFITKLRYKLEGNSDRFPDEKSRLIYAHSRLDRDPATLIDPLIGKDINTVDLLIQFLEATYGDPNRELTAWSRLDNLKQGKKSFLSHFAEFRRIVADTNLNEGAQINQLRRSLSDELRRAMVGVTIPRSLNDYANLIALYDNDLRYLPATRTTTSTKQARYPVEMEIDVSNYAPKGSAERRKRIAEGRCFKCNGKDHISRDCSVALPRQQIRAHSAPASEGTRSIRSHSSSSSRSRGRRHRKRSPKGKASSRG